MNLNTNTKIQQSKYAMSTQLEQAGSVVASVRRMRKRLPWPQFRSRFANAALSLRMHFAVPSSVLAFAQFSDFTAVRWSLLQLLLLVSYFLLTSGTYNYAL